jgi:arsenate reductase (thioredoxin)
MDKRRVLFICTRNSARSQMAEAWLNRLGGEWFEAESAGLAPGTLKPAVVKAMGEAGVDISGKGTQTVAEALNSGRRFDYVVALYGPDKAEQCPAFPGATRLHWDVPERPKTTEEPEEQLAHVRKVRDMIRDRVTAWVTENR